MKYKILIEKSKRRISFFNANCREKDLNKIERIALEMGLSEGDFSLELTNSQSLVPVMKKPTNQKENENILFQTNTRNYQEFERRIYANGYCTINLT